MFVWVSLGILGYPVVSGANASIWEDKLPDAMVLSNAFCNGFRKQPCPERICVGVSGWELLTLYKTKKDPGASPTLKVDNFMNKGLVELYRSYVGANLLLTAPGHMGNALLL